MSFLIKSVLMVGLVVLPGTVFAGTPCKTGLVGISLIEGPSEYDVLRPDTESLKPTGKWPNNLIEQGWHNLRKAHRPLRIECRYANGQKETLFLPDTTDTCVLKPGLVVTCQ